MAKSENQKLKLLYIIKILTEETDEQSPCSTKELIEKLSEYGISAERKTIYSDIECLRDFGYDIGYDGNRTSGGYYLASRDFELAELKMLVDMVQASRFLSVKRSRELIKKIEQLAGKREASELQRSVYVANRAKAVNEGVFYAVDCIHRAIAGNKSISFHYLEYTVGSQWQLRRGGKRYEISPWFLTWNQENYYLIAFDEERQAVRHYRVDRMKDLEINERDRQGREYFRNFDIAAYSKVAFNMYGGEEKRLKLVFVNSLANVVVDRFGKDVTIRKEDEEHFSVNVNVAVSPQFYGWLAGFGANAKLVSPKAEAQAYREYLEEILKSYS
ncbi:MAG: WYL domain-containing protein [Lachnospiraceae bacterium]|nr:WYL domain-containing protein [Lachnospiraceae bacterium]